MAARTALRATEGIPPAAASTAEAGTLQVDILPAAEVDIPVAAAAITKQVFVAVESASVVAVESEGQRREGRAERRALSLAESIFRTTSENQGRA